MGVFNCIALSTLVLASYQVHAQRAKDARLPQLGYLSDGFGRADTAMSPDEAGRAEQQLEANPEDLGTRAKLLKFYWYAGLRAPRLDSIFWLIEHHPESDLHENQTAGIFPVTDDRLPSWFPDGNALNDSNDYTRAVDLWREQIQRHPKDAAVLFNAARVLGFDGHGGVELAEDAQRIDPARYTAALASLYSQFLLSVRRDSEAQTIIAAHLAVSTDAKLISATAGKMLESANQETMQGSKTTLSPEAVQEIATLIKRGQTLEPDTRQWSEMMQGASQLARYKPVPSGNDSPDQSKPLRIRVGGGVAAGNRVYAPTPAYPVEAKAAGIQGTVKLTILIAADGHVSDIKIDSGPSELVDAAKSAVAQYVYQPVMVDGRPAEVITTVEVAFQPQ